MKKLIYVSLFGVLNLISFKGSCQYNLVPDPSFELYTTCPISVSQIPNLIHWTKALISASPDYLNVCNNIGSGVVGVPQNRFGYQLARTGQGYVGLCAAYVDSLNPAPNYREYVQTALIDTLKAGVEYTISFYISVADSCGRYTNSFGAYFSNIEIDTNIMQAANAYLPFQPQFQNPETNDLGNRNGWTFVSGNFIASGGERYLVLGNFQPHQNTILTQTGWGTFPPNMKSAYHYLEDILVTPTDSLTSIIESIPNVELSLLTLNDGRYEIKSQNYYIETFEVINYLGQILDRKVDNLDSKILINTVNFKNGVYFIRVRLKNQTIHIIKIIKV